MKTNETLSGGLSFVSLLFILVSTICSCSKGGKENMNELGFTQAFFRGSFTESPDDYLQGARYIQNFKIEVNHKGGKIYKITPEAPEYFPEFDMELRVIFGEDVNTPVYQFVIPKQLINGIEIEGGISPSGSYDCTYTGANKQFMMYYRMKKNGSSSAIVFTGIME